MAQLGFFFTNSSAATKNQTHSRRVAIEMAQNNNGVEVITSGKLSHELDQGK